MSQFHFAQQLYFLKKDLTIKNNLFIIITGKKTKNTKNMKEQKSSCCKSHYWDTLYPQYWREDNYICSSCMKNCTIVEIEDGTPSLQAIYITLGSFIVIPLSLATFLYNTTTGIVIFFLWILWLFIITIKLQ